MISSDKDKRDEPKYKSKSEGIDKGKSKSKAVKDKSQYQGQRGHKFKINDDGKLEFKPPKKISERYLYNSGLAYLQRFPASSYHFKSVMMRKVQKSCKHHEDVNIEDCEKWLDALVIKFQNLSLLDDAAYLKGMITSFRRRGMSSMQITMRLQQKGYQADSIKKELEEYDTIEFNTEEQGDIYAALIFARKKRLGPYDVDERRTFEKSLATMARAGYSYDIARKTLEITPNELEEKLTKF